jgi:oxygen-independent coproporphyrinogen-3 oxidase
MPPTSAYIHVPFCLHRCGYCDFAIAVGRDDLVKPYLAALSTELSWLGAPQPVDTLYFGGGTPNYLEDGHLARLCDAVLAWHPLNPNPEWTVEANPECVTASQLQLFADRGVTRISLGLQSLDDAKLRALDRRHDACTALAAVDKVRRAGLGLSIDLIFAAPGETLTAWRRDLNAAIALAPDHISTYGLTFEHNTPFTAQRDRGALAELDEDLQLAMYAEAIDALTAAGYEHYEVSNFARPGRRSRHNEVYWAGAEYFAAGPGAARYVAGVRETNHRSTPAYIQRVVGGQSPVADHEELSPERRARELLVLNLRRMQGANRQEFTAKTGFSIEAFAAPAIQRLIERNLLEDDGVNLRLTRKGLYISDALWPELL